MSGTQGWTGEERRRVGGPMEVLVREITDFRQALEGYQKALDDSVKRIGQARVAATVGLVVGVLGVILATLAVIVGLNSWHAVTEFKAGRAESRHALCVQFNVQQRNAIAADAKSYGVLADQLSPPSQRTSTEQREVAQALRVLHITSVQDHPFQNCSKAGIEHYYANPPHDPALTTTTPKP